MENTLTNMNGDLKDIYLEFFRKKVILTYTPSGAVYISISNKYGSGNKFVLSSHGIWKIK